MVKVPFAVKLAFAKFNAHVRVKNLNLVLQGTYKIYFVNIKCLELENHLRTAP